jgi:hypothetical protein
MRFRSVLLTLVFFTGLASSGLASAFSEAAERLDGEWRGGDFVLRIDARRAQASVDAARPFAWDRFLVKEATGSEVVFTIGSELYQATIDNDTMTLTGTSFRGTRVLFRLESALRGTE